jgi:hypothetical protein
VAFGLAISEDRQHAAIVAAGRSDRAKILVDLAPFYDHPRGAPARMAGLFEKHDPVAVALDARSQAGTLVKPLAELGIMVTVLATEDVVVAHGEFLDLVGDQLLEHLDQGPLTAAVRAAQQRRLGGAQAWEPKVPVDQAPLLAATVAVWAFRRWEELSKPGVYVV